MARVMMRPMTHDEALLWLNDRVGKVVQAEIWSPRGKRGKGVTAPLTAKGELRPRLHRTFSRKDYTIGWYFVGDTSLDLSDLEEVEFDGDESQIRGELVPWEPEHPAYWSVWLVISVIDDPP